jgi:hypothetical protein
MRINLKTTLTGRLRNKQRSFTMSPLMNVRKLAISLAIFAVVAFSTSVAKADSVSFDLNVGNSGISGFPGPYAQVTINRTSLTTATITFTAYAGFSIGGGQAVDLNFNGGPVTYSGLSFVGGCTGGGCPVGGTAFTGGWQGVPGNNADGFGKFNFILDNSDGATNSVTSVTFNVSCATCVWNNVNQVLTGNATGHTAAAHIFVTGSNCGGSPCTGFASNGNPPEVPEPASMMLLGTGLLGIAAVFRKRHRK